jgi:hypothetical protein
MGDSAQICHQRPSLEKRENNVLVLLTWSSTVNSLPQVLTEWAASDDGLNLYQRLIKDVQDSQSAEQLALTLAAMLCYKRLLPYPPNEMTQSIKGFYLADFDALLNAERLRNERAVLERMIFSILRVFDTFGDKYHDMRQFLATVLDEKTPLLESFDGFSDQYWVRRMKSMMTHEHAYGRMVWLRFYMETEVELDTDTRTLYSSTNDLVG